MRSPLLTDGVVLLRPPTDDDVDAITRACQDPVVAAWVSTPQPYERSHAEGFLAHVVQPGWESGRELVWSIRDATDDRLLGMIGLHGIAEGSAEIGFWMASWGRGGGVATRAVALVVDHALDPSGLDLVRLLWQAFVGNWPSRRIAWRSGFRVEGTIRQHVVQRDGVRRDAWVGTLLRDDPREPNEPWPVDAPAGGAAHVGEDRTMTTTTHPAGDLAGNPFATPSGLPYGLPDFAAVRDEHYLPAFRAGMATQLAEIEAIVTDTASPDEDNTLLALERSGRLLHRVALAFFNVVSADRSPRLAEIEAEIAPLLAAHRDAIYLDRRLFDRIEALAARVDDGEVALPDDAVWLLHTLRKDFGRAGVSAPSEVQAEVRAANTRISGLETTFGQRLVADANASAVLLPDAADLDGLPEDAIGSARSAAERRGLDGYLVELRAPSQQPVLASLRRREVRRRVHEASVARGGRGGEHDTREVLLELVRLRARRAQLLGYPHHAAYVAEDGTARTTAAVDEVLVRLAPAATANARREAADLERALQAEVPGARLEAWDWGHYAERVRRQRYSLDDALLRPYLELGRVLRDGVFHAATELYGLTFQRRPDLPGYHPDVEVYEVLDADGTGLGLFLADWYTRDAKEGGAWMNNLVDQSHLLAELPVVVNNHNITPPPPGEPTLLTWDEVTTLFHEFGHALHGLLSDVRLPSQSGTEVPRDFVEYPSQVNEIWAWDPEVLARYAVHHVTGEPMPEAWIRTLLDARQFNEGFGTTEYLAAALLDQAWHQLAPDAVPDDVGQVAAFEQAALAAAGVAFEPVPPRYRTTYFNHVFGGGYAAAYYSYIWSEVLDADTAEWFTENGGLRREAGERFRRVLLSRGGSLDVMDAFRELRGREPRIEPLLVRRGLA